MHLTTHQRRKGMRTALVLVGLLALSTGAAHAQPAAAPSCEAQLAQANSEKDTVVQLWRDIQQSRSQFEIQLASVRVALGSSCAADKPVSVCVGELVAKLSKPAAKSAPAEPKK